MTLYEFATAFLTGLVPMFIIAYLLTRIEIITPKVDPKRPTYVRIKAKAAGEKYHG